MRCSCSRPSLSRRALLGGVSGLAAGQALPAEAATPPTLTVMTRNLYVGVDVTRLFRARSMDGVRRVAGRLLEDVQAHPYPARIDALAAEVAATEPDVVGVQEAAVIRTQRPSDFDEERTRNATAVLVDLLDLFTSKLDARGLHYEVVASTANTDLEVPADHDGGQVDVRVTDRTALLVREDVETGATRTGRFDATLSYPMDSDAVSIHRGYCSVDVTVGGTDLTVATTHLESAASDPRVAQARELLDLLPADRPVVLAGDFNSGPGGSTAAYDLLAESFEDAHATVRPHEDGFTCCQAADLRNDESRLSRRVDAVLARGGLDPVAVERVGAAPADRVRATVDGEQVRLWPSDHAGVVASVEVTPAAGTEGSTASPSVESGSSPEPTPADDGGRSVPLAGFGWVAAVFAIFVAALARRHRSE